MGRESLNLPRHSPKLAYQIYRTDAQLLAGKPGARRTGSEEEIHCKYTGANLPGLHFLGCEMKGGFKAA